jgi:hypothetical protein
MGIGFSPRERQIKFLRNRPSACATAETSAFIELGLGLDSAQLSGLLIAIENSYFLSGCAHITAGNRCSPGPLRTRRSIL